MMLNESVFTEYKDWQYVDSKDVEDSDGFITDYTWYKRDTKDGEEHIFIFGDSDIYGPDDSVPDYETDSQEIAQQWFDNYKGFEDELDEALYSRDFAEFKKIADEIGLKTAADVERFRKEEVRESESDLEAIKRYRDELGPDFQLKESLESECAKYNLIINELSEEEFEGFDIGEIVNSYDNVAYYCVDTGNGEQVVIALDLDSKRITIEEDTDGLGFGVGDEYKNAKAFMRDYLNYTNLTECLHTEVLTERYLSGRYVWCDYKDIQGMNIYQLCKHIEKLYKDKFGKEVVVNDAIDQSYDYSNKELPFIVEADLGDEESVKGCDGFWFIVNCTEEEANKLRGLEENLTEGKMKELATEIENEGGKDKWLAEMSKRIAEMRDMLSYLKNEAPREVNKGGNFDSYEELAEAVADIEKELDELLVKVRAVA